MKAGDLGKVGIMFDRLDKQLVCLLDVPETPLQLHGLHKHLHADIINTTNTYAYAYLRTFNMHEPTVVNRLHKC